MLIKELIAWALEVLVGTHMAGMGMRVWAGIPQREVPLTRVVMVAWTSRPGRLQGRVVIWLVAQGAPLVVQEAVEAGSEAAARVAVALVGEPVSPCCRNRLCTRMIPTWATVM